MKPNWFIAWPVPPGPWLTPLLADAPRFLRRFHPDDLHVTLAFLGPVSAERASAAWAVAQGLPLRPVTATLERLEGFGDPRAPSAFSLALRDHELVHAIAASRGPLAKAAGVDPDGRPPRPHCTVARPARDATKPARAAGLAWARGVPTLNVGVSLDRLALYTWSADRRERQFQAVFERSLT